MNINKIHLDIIGAELFLNQEDLSIPSSFYNDAAAYHIQQAIEKSLKFILHDQYGVDDTTKQFKTHSLTRLIDWISNYEQNFKNEYIDLYNIALTVTIWEATCRYDDSPVADLEEILEALNIAKKLYYDIENRLQIINEQKNNPNP